MATLGAMRPKSRAGLGRLFASLAVVACSATPQSNSACAEWEARFVHVRAGWTGGATTRAALERAFGLPERVETGGACIYLHYSRPGCSASFAVCSGGEVVSKSFTMGAAAVPALITTDPAGLAAAVEVLKLSLRETQEKIGKLEQVMAGVAEAPVPPASPAQIAPAPPPPPVQKPVAAAAAQCIATTRDGGRCSRRANQGSQYCWQHRRPLRE